MAIDWDNAEAVEEARRRIRWATITRALSLPDDATLERVAEVMRDYRTEAIEALHKYAEHDAAAAVALRHLCAVAFDGRIAQGSN